MDAPDPGGDGRAGQPAGDVVVGRRPRRRLLVVSAVLVLVLAAGAVAAVVSGTSEPGRRSSGPAVEFELADLRDERSTVSLSQFRGRPVVVNFWASWCVPCRKEMPAFQRVYERHKDTVAFVGIDHQDGREDALAFLRKTGVRYPVAHDPEGRTAPAYGLIGLPGTVFISADGRMLERHTGELSESALERRVERLSSPS